MVTGIRKYQQALKAASVQNIMFLVNIFILNELQVCLVSFTTSSTCEKLHRIPIKVEKIFR